MDSIDITTTNALLEIFIVILSGLCFGSFATAVIYREPKGISWITDDENNKKARSACTSCGHTLGVLDLIPVLSYLSTLGKCRYCSVKISAFYWMVEVVNALLFLVVYWAFGLTLQAIIISVTTTFLLCLLIIDCRHYILPNRLNIIVLFMAILFHLKELDLNNISAVIIGKSEFIVASILLPLLIWSLGYIIGRIKKRDALGMGDVKLFAASGMWLGIEALPLFLFICGVFGVLTALLWNIAHKQKVFPFGPAIIVSLFLGILVKYSSIFPSEESLWQIFMY